MLVRLVPSMGCAVRVLRAAVRSRTATSVAACIVACSPAACGAKHATGSPGTRSTGIVQAGVTVVTHDRALGHAEPDVAVNPRNGANLLGACQFILAARLRVPGAFASFDGGRTWGGAGVLSLPDGFEQGADTTVGFDSQGTGFVVALMTHGGGGYASRVKTGGIFVWRTRDGGRSFAEPQPVFVGPGFQDHPWLVIRGRRLFVVWTNRSGLVLSSSFDDGRTFTRPRVIVASGKPADPVLTLAGAELRVFFQEFIGTQIRIATVLIDGKSGGRPQTPRMVATVAGPALGTGPKGGAGPQPLLGAAASGHRAAVAIAAQSPTLGHPVIELWQTDGGDHWQGPSRVADGAPAALSQEQPRLLYAASRLYVLYFTTSRQGAIDTQLASAPIGSGTWKTDQLTDSSFPAPAWLGDYQALTAEGRNAYALWNDGHGGRLEIVARKFPVR